MILLLNFTILWLRKPIPFPVLTTSNSTAQETWFYMRKGAQFKRIDEVRETNKLSATMEVDQDMMAALTADDGMFRPGQLPQIQAASEGGAKKILQAVGEARMEGVCVRILGK